MKKIISLLIALSLFMPITSYAETSLYVSDELEINMRNGKGIKFGIKRVLKSGTKLTIIETDPTGYTKVKTQGGTIGWVLSRYLTSSPSPRSLLASSVAKVTSLELELAKYKEEISALTSQNSSSGSENMTLKETSQRLSKELDDLRRTASNAVALSAENSQLKQKLQQIDNQIQSLIIENTALKDSDAKNWFLIGAAVLFAGLLLGLILPRLRLQKKSSWGSF